jgi:hypothetical protein
MSEKENGDVLDDVAPTQMWPTPTEPVTVGSVLCDLFSFSDGYRNTGDRAVLQAALCELCQLATVHPTDDLLQLNEYLFEHDAVLTAFLFMRHLRRHSIVHRTPVN